MPRRNRACRFCEFFVQAGPLMSSCHRYPPSLPRSIDDETGLPQHDSTKCEFPIVDEANWCGEFKEAKTNAAM